MHYILIFKIFYLAHQETRRTWTFPSYHFVWCASSVAALQSSREKKLFRTIMSTKSSGQAFPGNSATRDRLRYIFFFFKCEKKLNMFYLLQDDDPPDDGEAAQVNERSNQNPTKTSTKKIPPMKNLPAEQSKKRTKSLPPAGGEAKKSKTSAAVIFLARNNSPSSWIIFFSFFRREFLRLRLLRQSNRVEMWGTSMPLANQCQFTRHTIPRFRPDSKKSWEIRKSLLQCNTWKGTSICL